MKKVIILLLVLIGIPYLTTLLFIKKDNEIKFYFTTNMTVRIKRENSGNIDTVPLEDYIVGVLAGEMPVSFELDALKAQAVAARTYVMKKMTENYKNKYDILDTPVNQMYVDEKTLKSKWQKNYEKYMNKIKQAVLETRGEYITYDDKIIDALFFSTSTGMTENSEEVFLSKQPYLRSVDSSWDEEVSPVFNENNDFSFIRFYQLLGLDYSDDLNIKVIETTSTGRIKKIKINNEEFTGNTIANKLGLRSSHFNISQTSNSVKVTTKGYGHGVGMSQYGAQAMALKGYSYDKILKHYYQGIEIKKI